MLTNTQDLIQILRRVSYSDINTYLSCPHKFDLLKIKGLRDNKQFQDNSIALDFGKAIHNVLAKVDLFSVQLDILKQNFRDEFYRLVKLNSSRYATPATSQDIFDLAAQAEVIALELSQLFKQWQVNYEIVSREDNFELLFEQASKEQLVDSTFASLPIKGFIDLILKEKNTGEIIIADYKTTTKEWVSDFNKILQLIIYKYFWYAKTATPLDKIKTQFIVLKKVGKPKVEIVDIPSGQEVVKEYFGKINEVLNKILMADFPKNKSEFNCKYCPFNDTKWCKEV